MKIIKIMLKQLIENYNIELINVLFKPIAAIGIIILYIFNILLKIIQWLLNLI